MVPAPLPGATIHDPTGLSRVGVIEGLARASEIRCALVVAETHGLLPPANTVIARPPGGSPLRTGVASPHAALVAPVRPTSQGRAVDRLAVTVRQVILTVTPPTVSDGAGVTTVRPARLRLGGVTTTVIQRQVVAVEGMTLLVATYVVPPRRMRGPPLLRGLLGAFLPTPEVPVAVLAVLGGRPAVGRLRASPQEADATCRPNTLVPLAPLGRGGATRPRTALTTAVARVMRVPYAARPPIHVASEMAPRETLPRVIQTQGTTSAATPSPSTSRITGTAKREVLAVAIGRGAEARGDAIATLGGRPLTRPEELIRAIPVRMGHTPLLLPDARPETVGLMLVLPASFTIDARLTEVRTLPTVEGGQTSRRTATDVERPPRDTTAVARVIPRVAMGRVIERLRPVP